MTKSLLKSILVADQTVFSFKELFLLAQPINEDALRSRLHYYIKTGDLYHIRRGLYAKDDKYDHFELATKIFIPSYISFETVLVQVGIVFQFYSQIFVATYQTREVMCDGQVYAFRRLKETILTNSLGIEMGERYSIASKERAFLDMVYLFNRYHFDNLEPLNWDLVYEMVPLYEKENMIKRVDGYYNVFKRGL